MMIYSRKDKSFCAWAAGLFEGEGCVFVERKKAVLRDGRKRDYWVYSMRLDIANTDIRMLDAIKAGFGGSIALSTRKNSAHKPCFHWRIAGVGAADMLRAILPFMVGSKKRQAEIAIDFSYRYSAQGLGVRSKVKSTEEKADQDKTYHMLQNMKQERMEMAGHA